MKKEEYINQKKFHTEVERALINIMYTASWIDSLHIQRLKPHSLSPQQYNVLRILRGVFPGKLKLADISERMIDKNSNSTRLVEKLREKGFVKRELCETNRRQVDIEITKKGLDTLLLIDEESKLFFKKFKTCTKNDYEELARILGLFRI